MDEVPRFEKFLLWKELKYSELPFDPVREDSYFVESKFFDLEIQKSVNNTFILRIKVKGELNATRLLDPELKYCKIYYSVDIKANLLKIYLEYSEADETPGTLKQEQLTFKLKNK